MIDVFIALGVILAAVCLLALAITRGWLTIGRRGSFTGMAIYHDWSSQDKQKAIEVIIERNAGRKEKEDDSGEPDFEDVPRTPENPD